MNKQVDNDQLSFKFEQCPEQVTTARAAKAPKSSDKIISFQAALNKKDAEKRRKNYTTIAKLARHLG